jgi:hypothetical protein
MEALCLEKIAVDSLRLARVIANERKLQRSSPYAFETRGMVTVQRCQASLNRQIAEGLEKFERLQAQRKADAVQRPAYAFEEVLAAFGDATGATGAADTMLSQVEATAQRITGDETLRMPEIVEADRARVLAKYAFGSLPASAAKNTHPADEAVDTDFLRDVRAKEQLWRALQFKWHRLLSRRELDLLTDEGRKGFGRNMAFYLVQSERMQRVLRTADIGSSVSFVLALVVAIAISLPVSNFFYILRFRLGLYYVPRVMLFGASFVFAWMFFALVWGATAVREKPYGVRLSEVVSFVLLGPFRPDIRDYDPHKAAQIPIAPKVAKASERQ